MISTVFTGGDSTLWAFRLNCCGSGPSQGCFRSEPRLLKGCLSLASVTYGLCVCIVPPSPIHTQRTTIPVCSAAYADAPGLLMLGDNQPQQVTITGQTFKVNDCVLFSQGADTEVGRITAVLHAPAAGEQQLSLLRFLKPEQVLGGRQPFHGAKELIESDAVLQVPLSAVQGRARVFSLERFQGLSRVGALDFFARLAYRVEGEEYVPHHMPVYCQCEMPYNPDKFMLQCSSCMDWFHPECLQCRVGALGAQSKWQCPQCAGPAEDDDMMAAELMA